MHYNTCVHFKLASEMNPQWRWMPQFMVLAYLWAIKGRKSTHWDHHKICMRFIAGLYGKDLKGMVRLVKLIELKKWQDFIQWQHS